MVRRCTYPSIHFFVSRSRSVVDCALCGVVWYVWCESGVCVRVRVCVCVCVCVVCVCVCVLTWLYACDVCCGVYVVLWCCVFCWRCVWCGVVLCCFVWCGAARHAENSSACRFKTPPCVRSRRLRVYRENARMSNLALVSEFNCFFRSRCSIEMRCLYDIGRDSWDWVGPPA